MFFYIRNLGSGNQFLVDVDPKDTIGHLRNILVEREPQYHITRFIFAGQILQEELIIGHSGIYKECTVQVMTRRTDEIIEEQVIPRTHLIPSVPQLARQFTEEPISFGDVIVIHLYSARELTKIRFRKMRPYVTFVMDNSATTTRSAILKGQHPYWNQQFGFRFDSYATLNISIWSHNNLLSDDSLGHVEVRCEMIPRDQTVTRWIDLENTKSGSIHISIRRAAITSPEMRLLIEDICHEKKPWNSGLLSQYQVTLSQIVGESPWLVEGDEETNPALEILTSLLHQSNISLANQKTLTKVRTVLKSQGITLLDDMPSRYIWIVDMEDVRLDLYRNIQEASKGDLKYFRKIDNMFQSVHLLVFKSSEGAILTLLRLKGIYPNIVAGFSPSDVWTLEDANYVGLIEVYIGTSSEEKSQIDDEEDEFEEIGMFRTVLYALKRPNTLELYNTFSEISNPRNSLDLKDFDLVNSGPFSFDIREVNSDDANLTFRNLDSSEGVDEILAILRHHQAREAESKVDHDEIDDDQKDGALDPQNAVQCTKCDKLIPLMDLYVTDSLDGRDMEEIVCRHCRTADFQLQLREMSVDEVLQSFSMQDLQGLMSREELDNILDESVESFLNSKKDIVRCPKCEFAFEITFHHWSTKKTHFSNNINLGIDNRPLSDESKAHFLDNRFRCRRDTCGISFCRSCGEIPYHLGFRCDTYKDFVVAPKCRFCGVGILEHNRIKGNKYRSVENVCDDPECSEKIEKVCLYVYEECKHDCFGVREEENHPACLHQDCCGLNNNNSQNSSDLCTICFVEELGMAAVIQLECNHIFHFECIVSRLEAKWSGKRITFNYCKCPLCNTWMNHPMIENSIDSALWLQNRMKERIWELVDVEKLDEDPQVLDPESEVFDNPIELGFRVLSFYQCSRCLYPFFGGRVECGDLGEDNDELLICSSCTSNAFSDCDDPSHTEYFVHKCRYCCSLAVWCCGGTTHYCDPCHSGQYSNPERWLCPPKGEKECPLGLAIGSHKNGNEADCEMVLGCGICSDKYKVIQQKHEDLLDQQTRMKERIYVLLDEKNEDEFYAELLYDDGVGVFEYLSTMGGKQEFINCGNVEIVRVESNTIESKDEPTILIDQGRGSLFTTSDPGCAFVSVDMKYLSLFCTHVEITSQSHHKGFMRNFVIEGSNYGTYWKEMLTVLDAPFDKHSQTHLFELEKPERFNIIRVRNLGPGSEGLWNIAMGRLELYGTLYQELDRTEAEDLEVKQEETRRDQMKESDLAEWHSSSFFEFRHYNQRIVSQNQGYLQYCARTELPLERSENFSYLEVYVKVVPGNHPNGLQDWNKIIIGIGPNDPHVDSMNNTSDVPFGNSFGWGYSSNGLILHEKKSIKYGLSYGKTDIIGVAVDWRDNSIEFVLNGRPLGVAFTNIVFEEIDYFGIVAIEGAFGEVQLLDSTIGMKKYISYREEIDDQFQQLLSEDYLQIQNDITAAGYMIWDARDHFYRYGNSLNFMSESLSKDELSKHRLTRIEKNNNLVMVETIKLIPSFDHGIHFAEFSFDGKVRDSMKMIAVCILGVCLEDEHPFFVGDSNRSWGVSWKGSSYILQRSTRMKSFNLPHDKVSMVLCLDCDEGILSVVQGKSSEKYAIVTERLPRNVPMSFCATLNGFPLSLSVQYLNSDEMKYYEVPVSEAAEFRWVWIETVEIDGSDAVGGNTKILLDPPIFQGVVTLKLEVIRGGNLGIGFADHENGPLVQPWVGGGPKSYSVWSHGNQCGADGICTYQYSSNGNYGGAGSIVQLTADMNENTVSYEINGVYVGRFVNIPETISFVGYLGGGGFRIL